MKQEMQDVLENNILRFWLDKMVDHENGGFYGRIDGHGQLHPEAEKGAILNARILWSFSAAYRVLSSLPTSTHPAHSAHPAHLDYLTAATRAKDYFLAHFIDKEYGGVYWSLDYKGRPLDTKKQFYAIGFAIYALSEYARATGDREALDHAVALYKSIEEHSLDPNYNGYIEACTRDWQPIADMRLSTLDQNYPKSQNTHLHILEPYTNLLRALQQPCPLFLQRAPSAPLSAASVSTVSAAPPPSSLCSGVAAALRNLITLFTAKILDPETSHLGLFFNMDWTPAPARLESYGHDIECSWLLHEAAQVLGDPKVLAEVEPIVQMVAQASAKGLLPDGSLIHEANLDTGYVDDDRHWWVQAENVVGWMNIYQHFGDTAALDKAERCWQYIKHQLVDRENGEWYWSRRPDGTVNRDDDKAGFWKCPYHNTRMCLEIIEREIS